MLSTGIVCSTQLSCNIGIVGKWEVDDVSRKKEEGQRSALCQSNGSKSGKRFFPTRMRLLLTRIKKSIG